MSFKVLDTNKELDGEVSEEIYEIQEEEIVVDEESVYSGQTNDYEVSQAESQDASKEIYR